MSIQDSARVIKGNHHQTDQLMELIVSQANMQSAYRRVTRNGGTGGVDGMSVKELKPYLQSEWEKIKGQLLTDTYYPKPVRKVLIPKASGGQRELGIPTVVDRLIQQAVYQVLSVLYEPSFSENSYGFRPQHNAQQAVKKSQSYIQEDKRWVVDIDLRKFFDEVHHDRLLSKLRIRIKDKRVIHLIGRYLRSGMMENGIEQVRSKGTPQGSPLSPLLSNIVLDELDKELENRGLSHVRYADDFQIYVRTKRSAERVKASVTGFIAKRLRLQVNEDKSAVGRPWERDFLGYSFTTDKKSKLKPSKKSIKRLRKKIKEKLRSGKGRNLKQFIQNDLNALLRGWGNYFKSSETKGFKEELDQWLRRHLRKIKWRQWKRRWTRFQGLMARGLGEEQAVQSAFNDRGAWWNAGAPHMNLAFPKRYFKSLGLVSLADVMVRANR